MNLQQTTEEKWNICIKSYNGSARENLPNILFVQLYRYSWHWWSTRRLLFWFWTRRFSKCVSTRGICWHRWPLEFAVDCQPLCLKWSTMPLFVSTPFPMTTNGECAARHHYSESLASEYRHRSLCYQRLEGLLWLCCVIRACTKGKVCEWDVVGERKGQGLTSAIQRDVDTRQHRWPLGFYRLDHPTSS